MEEEFLKIILHTSSFSSHAVNKTLPVTFPDTDTYEGIKQKQLCVQGLKYFWSTTTVKYYYHSELILHLNEWSLFNPVLLKVFVMQQFYFFYLIFTGHFYWSTNILKFQVEITVTLCCLRWFKLKHFKYKYLKNECKISKYINNVFE